MLIHFMLGTLAVALACFVIGRLAGHPTLIGRKANGYRPAMPKQVEPAVRIVLRPAPEVTDSPAVRPVESRNGA